MFLNLLKVKVPAVHGGSTTFFGLVSRIGDKIADDVMGKERRWASSTIHDYS